MMNYYKRNNQQGLVRTVLLVIVLIVVLSFIGFDIRGFAESDIVQKNFSYVWNGVVAVWDNYLSEPVLYFWNNIFVTIIWESFIKTFESIQDGQQSFESDFLPAVGTTTQ